MHGRQVGDQLGRARRVGPHADVGQGRERGGHRDVGQGEGVADQEARVRDLTLDPVEQRRQLLALGLVGGGLVARAGRGNGAPPPG